MKIYHTKGTRGLRVIWACEELGIPYDVEIIDFSPTFRNSPEWRELSPTGKVPAMEDDGFVMYESGAMLQYVLDRYSDGSLTPTLGTEDSAHCLQWGWFAEATFARPLGDIIHHTLIKPEAERIPAVVEDARTRALSCLDAVEAAVIDADYLVANTFGAADIMMGYTLMLAQRVNVLTGDHPNATAYYQRLTSRDAFQKAAALG